VYRRLLGCFDRPSYRLAHELCAIDLSPLRLQFTNGQTASPDLAVFADGIGSTARAALLPDAHPQYSGYVAWRGVVPETELSDPTRLALDDAITYYVYANSHILVYPIPGRDGSIAPAKRLINIVWYRNYLSGDDLHDLLVDVNGVAREVSVPPGAVRQHHVEEAARWRRHASQPRSPRPCCRSRISSQVGSISKCRRWCSAAVV
jgi:2,6-dihydroxypyridine 3-monooxygenase